MLQIRDAVLQYYYKLYQVFSQDQTASYTKKPKPSKADAVWVLNLILKELLDFSRYLEVY